MPNTLNGSNLPSSGETKAPQVNGIGTQTKEISEVLITPERAVEIEIRKIFIDSFTSYREMEKVGDYHGANYALCTAYGNAKKMCKNEEIKESLIMSLGGDLHEERRKNRLYEPRRKPVDNDEWSESHGGAKEVDIANTKFEDLPPKWQESNYEAAKFAINLVYDMVISSHYPADPNNYPYPDGKRIYRNLFNFEAIENLSSEVHEFWKEKNSFDQDNRPELFVSYSELPEEEKAKDRTQVLQAIKKVEAKIQEGA